MKLKITLFAFVFLLMPAFASANIYFDDADGNEFDCSAIGVWSESTQTCAMDRDVAGNIFISDPGTTLDGNGHTLSSYSYQDGTGVEIEDTNGVTVKNLTLHGFRYGIFARGANYLPLEENVSLRNNTITESAKGIFMYRNTGFDISGNTVRGSDTAIQVLNSESGLVKDNVIEEGMDSYSWAMSVSSVSSSQILDNKADGVGSGFGLSQVNDIVFKGNTVLHSTVGLSLLSDYQFRNSFLENTFRDSGTGVNIFHESGGGGSFSFAPLSKLFAFAKNVFSGTAFADTDDDSIFFKNNFINNTRDVSLDGAAPVRFFRLSPDGGNYWDKNTDCSDGDADGFCDVPYVIDANLGVADNFPRVHKMGDIPTTIAGTETEDDGWQDAKGVADKTKFTFGVSYTGTAPSDVMLWTNDGNATSHYSLALDNGAYSLVQTFPKGHYGYHFEANGGTLRFPASGELSFTAGYSNVAFLPGLEASRLYRLDGTRLWEPEILHDNSHLYMNSDGTSILSGIYAGDIIDNAYAPVKGNIYQSFMGKMNDLKTDGTIHNWQSFPYDWRYSVVDTVDDAMVQKYRALAETSDTGKVTIIAHSNGGLVAKELTIKLGDDASKLTDQMIFVASPQSGTPSAVGAILHGFQQGLPFDNWLNNIITPSEARTLANNMPSAYGLLPSANYFTYTDDPVIKFGDFPLLADWRAKYGTTIRSEERLRNFMTDQNREALAVNDDLKNPWKGNTALFDNAALLHNTLDAWAPPTGVELTEIAGWGEETLKTIEYYQGSKTGCKTVATLEACHTDPALEFRPVMTIDGDGTVVTSSALWTSGARKYWVDLRKYNKEHVISAPLGRHHSDIFEVPELLTFVRGIVTRNSSSAVQYVSTLAPQGNENDVRLRFTLHSPLTIDFYDNLGNHTGVSTTTNQTEENIPGSRYMTFGEVKYVSIPSTANVRLFLDGYEEGSFTLEVETVSGDTVLSSSSFAGIPSNENTTATMNISAGGEISNLSPLLVDENGDGILEFTLSPKAGETVLPDLSPKKEESKPVVSGAVPVLFLSQNVIPSPRSSLKEEQSDGERGDLGEGVVLSQNPSFVIRNNNETAINTSPVPRHSGPEPESTSSVVVPTTTPSIQSSSLLATPFFPKTKAAEGILLVSFVGGALWIIWKW